jgi:DNA polymerase-3 subunit delta'
MHAFVMTNDQCSIINGLDTLVITPEKSIGIDEVKQIQTFLSRKPLGEKNQIYLINAHLMTATAQNAILKILEEPPGSSEIYLVTDQPDQLLPTILSRVLVVSARPQVPTFRNIDPETVTTREQALEYLNYLESKLHQDLSLLSTMNYELITKARKYLKANCNVKLCLDFVIS